MRAMAMVLALTVCSTLSTTEGPLSAEVAPESEAHIILVNREHRLPHDHVPEGLVLPEVLAAPRKEEAIYLLEAPARALERLFAAAGDAGHTLYAVSGYRSYSLQKSIFTRKVEAVGERTAMLTVAPPGASEHQLGLAMDINGESTLKRGLTEAFGESPEGLWVKENAHLYGFIIRYPQGMTHITGYAWEPWHLRYVGEAIAAEVHRMGVTFEEYHGMRALRAAYQSIKRSK